MASLKGLAVKATRAGVRIIEGVEVTGFEFGHGTRSVGAVLTDKGRIPCDCVVCGVGPWVRDFWDRLELPKTVSIKGRDGKVHNDIPMWHFWQL
ncbi:FAD-binding oxidoreductase [Mesorhizobium caraganae]|uniref:FAD-binding oxidoreductase n=1 Tax=Mesorhizobium caraganae TaxID=483206 RepID=A0ABV1Z8A5_9HYPH